MVLNFSWSSCPREYGRVGGGPSYSCTGIVAVHEFGHALGFAHEQNRPDTPRWCRRHQGASGDMMIGTWDAGSVMNYCNPRWNGDGNLSPGDIQAGRTIYGWQNGGRSVTRTGRVASCPHQLSSDSWTIGESRPR